MELNNLNGQQRGDTNPLEPNRYTFPVLDLYDELNAFSEMPNDLHSPTDTSNGDGAPQSASTQSSNRPEPAPPESPREGSGPLVRDSKPLDLGPTHRSSDSLALRCPFCGGRLSKSDLLCVSCGAFLDETEANDS